MVNLQADLSQISGLHSKNKLLLGGFLVLLLLAGLTLGWFTVKTLSPKSTAEPATVSQSRLSLLPQEQTLTIGQVLPVIVSLSGQSVTVADVVLIFDPQVFRAENIQAGPNFPSLLASSVSEGQIQVSTAVDPASPNPQTGELFSFSLTVLMPTSSSLVDFDLTQTVTALGGQNTLGETQGGEYNIQ